MKAASAVLLLFVFVCLSVIAIALDADQRLIEFGPKARVVMSAKEVDTLVQEGKLSHFLDVTDHPTIPSRKISWVKIPPAPRHKALVDSLLPRLKVTELHRTIEALGKFYTRYYTTPTGKEAAEFIHAAYTGYARGRPDIEVTFFQHSWTQPSVVARIKGKGPNADEVVILGGHEDSINGGANGQAPGADDDASGSSTVLEVFRTLVEAGFEPDRTVEFHAYAAEEIGLRGSQDIAAKYRDDGVKVAAMMQLDMTSYVRAGREPVVGLVQDFVNSTLTSFVGQLIDTYANIAWVPTRCGYACSDHASWTRMGFPSSFPFEGPFSDINPNIHSTRDTLDKLNLEHGLEFAKIGLSFVIELSLG